HDPWAHVRLQQNLRGANSILRRNLSSPAAQASVRLRADAAPSWRGVSLFARQGRSAVRPGAARRAFARTRGDAAQAVRAHPALTRAQYILVLLVATPPRQEATAHPNGVFGPSAKTSLRKP